MKSQRTTTAIAIATLLIASAPAFGDGKMISSAICQAYSPAGADHLQHNGSSLEAVGSDVTVICPVVKDSIGEDLNWVDVRHLRPSGSAGEVATGRVYSCDAAYGGCWSTSVGSSSASNQYTSVHLTTSNLPSSDDHYFYYRSVLPEGWKIVALEYVEN